MPWNTVNDLHGEFRSLTPTLRYDSFSCLTKQECSVCLIEFKPNAEIKRLSCEHVFHKSCPHLLLEDLQLCYSLPNTSTSLHDLEHLKLLYDSILRDRKLPVPAWKRQNVRYREIPGKLCSLVSKSQELKQRIASGENRERRLPCFNRVEKRLF
ncbi:hypothetical protein L1887_35642 [Cichorium endivia]|nr:hypothetical protein L1887_35642 [Cichorium endivia]